MMDSLLESLVAPLALVKENQRLREHQGVPVPNEWENLKALCDANRRDVEKYQDQFDALRKLAEDVARRSWGTSCSENEHYERIAAINRLRTGLGIKVLE
jgi:predicted  nucleic acid-binding Zn-ribbon protein